MTKTAKISLLSFLTVLLIAALCLVLGSTPPLQAMAARKTKYISEIRFADDHDEVASEVWLRNNGYTMLESGLGSNDYGSVGVKYTTDPNDALTDIKVMNMKGGYSFAEYESFLEREKAASEELVNSLSGGIEELQKRENTPGGRVARKMLNYFYEDDSRKPLGDLLIDSVNVNEESHKKVLTKIFMQGNGAANSVIKDAIAIGCLDKNGQNWMGKASAFSAENDGDLSSVKSETMHGVKAHKILETIKLMSKELENFRAWDKGFKEQFKDVGTPGKDENGNDIINLTEEESNQMEEYINASFKDNRVYYLKLNAINGILHGTTYKDKDHPEINNLADLFICANKLGDSDLIPIAQFFTDVQADVISVAGIQRFILNVENTQEYWDTVVAEMQKTEMLKKVEATSIYAGVDRTMFTEDGIAMTSDAIRQNLITPEGNPFLGNIDNTAEIAMFAAIAASGALAIGALTWTIIKGWTVGYVKAGSEYWQIWQNASPDVSTWRFYGEDLEIANKHHPGQFGTKISLSAKIFMGAMAVLLIVSIVFLTLELVSYYDQEMTRMPSAIVDNQYKDGKNSYVKYDALKFKKEGKDKPYDYNNEKGRQWQIIYASKDKRAGFPITDIKFSTSTSTYQSSHKPVALFGESAARDLKKYGPISVATKYEYMFFKQDPNAYPATGSVFNTGTFILTLCGGILGGAGLGVLATYLYMKRKKAKNKAETITYTTTNN